MTAIECFMGCQPTADGEGETFYVAAMPELTIYGHTIDAWISQRYPEDVQVNIDARLRGHEFACWHSAMCADGETGAHPIESIRPITFQRFMQAAEQGWPYDPDLTTLAPIAATGHVDENGRVVWDWSSLNDTLGERNQG